MNEQTQKIASWLKTGSINIFGRPFAGKDTQGQLLADMFHGPLIGGGDILRHHHDPEQIEKIMASGGIIPSDFYFEMVLPYLSREEFKNGPLILSAVGRSEGEETTILKATNDSGHPMRAVILLDLSEEEVWRRFDASTAQHDRGDRTDDHKEVLKNRLEKFRAKTLPVIAYYERAGLLIKVDGALSREEVTAQILQKLAARSR